MTHGQREVRWEDGDGPYSIFGGTDHRILECLGCEKVFYWTSSWNSEDTYHVEDPETGNWTEEPHYKIETYPAPETKSVRPDWSWDLERVDRTLGNIMNEVYAAVEAQAFILASIGLRTALDRVSELKNVEPSLGLATKLNELVSRGVVGGVSVVRTFGTDRGLD